MGLKSCCKIFETFSSAIAVIARKRLNIAHIVHLLDNFMILLLLLLLPGKSVHVEKRLSNYNMQNPGQNPTGHNLNGQNPTRQNPTT